MCTISVLRYRRISLNMDRGMAKPPVTRRNDDDSRLGRLA